MTIERTFWHSFRNLGAPGRAEWGGGLNLLIGPNGAGKTNFLESLNVLCGWGPFSGGVLPLVARGSDGRALLSCECGPTRVEVRIGARITPRLDGRVVSHSELRFAIPSLSFLPGDINLLEGSPGVRRYFLDRVCSLCSPLYARRLAEYRRLVKARGALLRSAVPDDRALRACSVPLAGLGRWIREARSRASAMLEEKLSERLSASLSDLSPAPLALSPVWAGGADIEAWFASSANLERERHARSVLVGPHRDDLLVAVAGVQRSAAEVFSRGHKRRAVVAMILAAGRLVEGRLRKSPVLLLDDVTAELDTEGRELTGRALTETGWQVFAAGTEEGLFGRSATSAVLWRVREGRIDSR